MPPSILARRPRTAASSTASCAGSAPSWRERDGRHALGVLKQRGEDVLGVEDGAVRARLPGAGRRRSPPAPSRYIGRASSWVGPLGGFAGQLWRGSGCSANSRNFSAACLASGARLVGRTDADLDEQVATAVAAEMRQALAGEPEDAAVLRLGRNAQQHAPVQRSHRHLAPESASRSVSGTLTGRSAPLRMNVGMRLDPDRT